jgi:hypothetical protein
VVNSLPVESGKAQIASVAFGTLAKVNFYFNTYKNKTAIVDDITNTDKGEISIILILLIYILSIFLFYFILPTTMHKQNISDDDDDDDGRFLACEDCGKVRVLVRNT